MVDWQLGFLLCFLDEWMVAYLLRLDRGIDNIAVLLES